MAALAKIQENLLQLLADSERLVKALDEFPVKAAVPAKPVEALQITCEQIITNKVVIEEEEDGDNDEIETMRMPSKTEISPIEDDDDEEEEAEKKRIKLSE